MSWSRCVGVLNIGRGDIVGRGGVGTVGRGGIGRVSCRERGDEWMGGTRGGIECMACWEERVREVLWWGMMSGHDGHDGKGAA